MTFKPLWNKYKGHGWVGRGCWMGIVAFLCARHLSATKDLLECQYGSLPGYWTGVDEEESYRWNLYDKKCRLKRLLEVHTTEGLGCEPKEPTGILFFGDSVDRELVQSFCDGIHRKVTGNDFNAFCVNRGSSLLLVKRHISGTNLQGPYWNNVSFPPLRSITQGLRDYEKAMGGPPDVAVVASNFWDLASWFANGGWTVQDTPSESEALPKAVLAQWTSNMTKILTHLKERAPRTTLLVYHTMHHPISYPVPEYHIWESDRYVAQHVAQLNAAGRHVARSLGYHILDLEAMATQMHRATVMADITHPQPWFLMEALNVLLNMDALNRQEAYAEDCEPLLSAAPLKVPSWSRGRASAPAGLLGFGTSGENGVTRGQEREAGPPEGAVEGTARLAAHALGGHAGKAGHGHMVHMGGHVKREGAGEEGQDAVQVATHVWRTVTGTASNAAVHPGTASSGENGKSREAAVHQDASVQEGNEVHKGRNHIGTMVGGEESRVVVGEEHAGKEEIDGQRAVLVAKHARHGEEGELGGLRIGGEKTGREGRLPSRFHFMKRILG